MDNFISEEDFWKDALSYDVEATTKSTLVDENPEIIEIDISKLSRCINPALNNKLFITLNGIYFDVTGIDNVLIRQLCNKFMVKSKSNFGGKWNIARAFNIIKRTIPSQGGGKPLQQTLLLLPRFGFLEFYFKTLIADQTRIDEGKRKAEYADMVFLKKLGLSSIMNIANQITTFLPDQNITAQDLKLAEHQTKVINYMLTHHFNSCNKEFGFAGINLKLKTGAGKSYIALGLIDHLKLPTLLVVHNQPQAEDMYQLAKKYFPNTSVGIYHSSKKILGKIMIIVIHSACGSDEYTFADSQTKTKTILSVSDFFGKFGLGIFDESHKYCSPEFSKVFSRCQFHIMMGLSATPGERQDGFDPITYMNVGPLIDIQEKIPSLLKDDPFTTQILGIKYIGPAEFTEYKISEHGMFDNNATLIQMMEDPYRLEMIVDILEFISKNKRHAYIFSDRLEYLSIIRRALFDRLRKSNNLPINMIETLDDEIIEFMKSQPVYEKYCKELTESINSKISSDFKRIQEELNKYSIEEFYNSTRVQFYNGEINNNAWYCPALVASDYKSYTNSLIQVAQQQIQKLQNYYQEAFKNESSIEYYNQLLETYKKNYIDDYIESKSTLSILTGGAKGDQINLSAEKATMIFTTYGYMGTGKSIPKMDTILFVTPRRNGVEQVIGRVFRPGPNKNERWILDIIDWKINLKSQWYERLNVYERQKNQNRNPTLNETEINFTNIKIKENLCKIFNNNPIVELIGEFKSLEINNNKKATKKIRIIKKF
jgi:superfamily II DNA or RNA helicase